jgi:23S rRNA-/tRNA-specific pseudouridylate synthase
MLKEFKDFTLLEIKPVTGRTHQIRVHLSAAGHPVVGDDVYGRRKGNRRFPRLFLHAYRLAFTHPEKGERVEFFAPLPEDLKNVLDSLK